MALTKPRAYQIYDIDYKQAVRVVTTSNITLAGGAPNSVDGVNLSLNDRILVTAQTSGVQNGIYYVTTLGTGATGTWTRAVDTDTTGELLSGTIVMVTEGTTYADTQWKLTTNDPITIGVTALTFVQNYLANSISYGATAFAIGSSNANATVSVAGTSNVAVFATTGEYVTGLVSASGNITSAGNVSATYLLGNVFYATGISASKIYNGTTEANIGTSGGNANISVGGTSNVAVFATTGEYVTGLISASGNITSAANVAGGNLLATTTVSAASHIGSIVSVTGNVTGGNLNVTGNIVDTGALTIITGSNGNIALAPNGTGIVTASSALSASGNITSAANITGGNLLTGGLISATGNATVGNISATIGTFTTFNSSQGGSVTGTLIATSANAQFFNQTNGAGYVTVAGYLSAAGNITTAANVSGNYLLGNVFFATGITASKIYNGTSEVNVGTSGGPANISIGGTSNVAVFSSTGVAITGDLSVSGNATLSGNILGDRLQNGTTSIDIQTASGNANISVGGTSNVAVFSTAGQNITGNLSVTGNVTGRYFLGNANVQYTAATAPVSGNLIGAQWYNTSTDVLYEYQTDGTSTYWVDITGPIIGSNGAAGGTTLTNGTSNVSVALNGNATVNIAGTPNVAVITSTGANVNGNLTVTYAPATAVGASIALTGANTQGGTGYADFLKATNASGGATNANKTLRLSSAGALEIINSAYTATLLALSDAGNVSIAGQYQVAGKQAVNGPAFRAYPSVGQTITSGSLQKVNFGSESFDTNSNFASSRFTPTVEGYYHLNSTVRLDGASGTGECMIVLYKNGSEYSRGWNSSGTQFAASFWSMTVTDVAYANGTTDYFEVYVQQGSGASVTTTAFQNISYFSGCMIRGA